VREERFTSQPGEMRLITNDDMVCKDCVYALEKALFARNIRLQTTQGH
jgi:hypothetical protein